MFPARRGASWNFKWVPYGWKSKKNHSVSVLSFCSLGTREFLGAGRPLRLSLMVPQHMHLHNLHPSVGVLFECACACPVHPPALLPILFRGKSALLPEHTGFGWSGPPAWSWAGLTETRVTENSCRASFCGQPWPCGMEGDRSPSHHSHAGRHGHQAPSPGAPLLPS